MERVIKRSFSFVMAVIMLMSCMCLGCYVSAVDKITDLKASTVTTDTITLKWSKVSGAKTYKVYRYNTSTKKWKVIDKVTKNTYTDEKLTSGKLYSYGVRAVAVENKKNVEGKASNIVKVVTKPAKVGSLKSSSLTDTSVKLSWTKAAGAQGYGIYRYDSSTKKYTYVGKTTSTSYTVKSLSASTSYVFAVRAYTQVKGTVYGAYSEKLTVKTKAPSIAKVTGLKLHSVKDNGFRLSWTKVSGATGYQVAVYDTSAKKWVLHGTTTKTYIDVTVKNAKEQTYRVRAYVKSGSKVTYGSYSSSTVGFAKPGIPQNLQGAENSSSGISLAWSKVEGADGYEIYSYDAVNGKWVAEGTATKNTYNVKGLKETSHYKYKVRAYRASDNTKFYGDFCESVTVAYTSDSNDSIYSEEMEKSGIFGYLYDPTGKYFYTSDDPWQRNVGYNSIFDTAAPLSLINFETARLRFEYEDKDWMIQLWRGQYGLIFYGAEVGVYTKPKDRSIMHYDCASDDEMLKMSMVFKEKKSGKWVERFTRPYGYYWWCTGFLPGNKYGKFDTLQLDMRITAKDYTMLEGIKSALESNKYAYTVSGLDVYFSF